MAFETQTKDECDTMARELISQAVARCAADHSSEATVSVVPLPSDEMKGRIIGREGRNIRALETATGVDLIIDDTPEAITLSSFDPVRREVARMTLEKLISDGRIHPARIEETVEKCRRELELAMKREGEKAVMDVGVHGIHPDMVKLLGRLRYRTSYGQNVLNHSMEVAFLSGMIAHHEGAVDMAKVFLATPKKDQDPQVTAWAEDVIKVQEKEIAEMKDLLKPLGGIEESAYAPMKKAMQHMLEEGKNLGANMRFVELMLPHHAMALEMSVPALLGSNNPQILNLAENIIISQAKEMRQFKAWIAEHHKK